MVLWYDVFWVTVSVDADPKVRCGEYVVSLFNRSGLGIGADCVAGFKRALLA